VERGWRKQEPERRVCGICRSVSALHEATAENGRSVSGGNTQRSLKPEATSGRANMAAAGFEGSE